MENPLLRPDKEFRNQTKAHRNNIIMDRKKKRFYYMMDDQVKDPLGLEQARENKANTIEVPNGSDNVIDKFLLDNHKAGELLGKKVWCMKDDMSRMFCGWITNVYPSRHLLVRVSGKNMPMTFQSVISLGEG